jgi:DNA-binding winged helix-turn-helix (wHTH) protein
MIFVFDEYELDEETFELRRLGSRVELQRKSLDLLVHLLRHRDRVVLRRELIEHVWGGVLVSENAIAQAVAVLRRATSTGAPGQMIETVRGRGYRFVRHVVQHPRVSGGPPAPESARVVVLAEPVDETYLAAAAWGAERTLVVDAARRPTTTLGPWVVLARGITPRGGRAWHAPDERRIDAVLGAIRSAAAGDPLLLVLRAIDAADIASILLFSQAPRLLAGAPVVVVGTCAPQALAREDVVGALLRPYAAHPAGGAGELAGVAELRRLA